MTDPEWVRSWRFSPWQKAVALAPALLLLVYLPAQMMLRCRTDGLLRSVCCCPQKGDTESKRPDPVAKGQDCCDQEVAQHQRPKAEAASSSSREVARVATVAVVSPLVSLSVPATDRFDRAAQRHGPARKGPPIVLLKQAFLI